MHKKLIAAALALLLVGGCLFGVFAFEDTTTHWANENIERAVSLGLFSGVSETEFRPDAPMTRAMFVTVLGRMAGIDPEEWEIPYLSLLFSDVDPNGYYAPYVAWAVHMGIADGTGSGKFSPNDNVTREQMARFIGNYLDATGSRLELRLPQIAEDEAPADEPLPEEAGLTEDAGPSDEPALSGEDDPADGDPEGDSGLAAIPQLHPYDTTIELTGVRNETGLRLPEEALPVFSDADEISGWAQESVELLVSVGVLNGMPDGSGGVRFAPKNHATRAECATLFCRVLDRLVPPEAERKLPTGIVINESYLNLDYEESASLVASVFPFDADNDHVLWFSTEPETVQVDRNGVVTGVGPGPAFVYAVTCNGHLAVCELFVNDPPEPEPEPEPEPIDPTPPAAGLANAGMSDREKDLMLFGREVDDPRTVYLNGSSEEARADMQAFQIRVWDLDDSGVKYTRTFWLEVHKNLVPTVQAIFEDIYNLPEKPVIHTIGGWRWDGKCEHTCGTAIDINFMENPYVSASGTVLVGGAFEPGVNPYSIPIGGSIDQIFAKYGFTRGIYWRNGTKDYMHYSFYGM